MGDFLHRTAGEEAESIFDDADQSNTYHTYCSVGRTYIYDPIRNNWSGDHDRTGCFFVPEYGC